MKIEVDNYVITSDPMNIILSEVKTRVSGENVGERYTEGVGYFATVEQALASIAQRKLRASAATSIAELRDDIQGIYRMIERHMTVA